MPATASFVVVPFYRGNRLFDLADPVANRDDCLVPSVRLKSALERRGFRCGTADVIDPRDADVVLHYNMPASPPGERDRAKSWLLLFENALIEPRNWRLELHDRFRGVFTWHSELIARGGNYVPMRYAQPFPATLSFGPIASTLACLIASRKESSRPGELYSARRDVIAWFERHHPDDFEFYGMGWDAPSLFSRGIAGVRVPGAATLDRWSARVPGLRGLATERHSSYRGPVASKRDALARHRFAFAYENAEGIPGYITEKLFDAFFAGCVPVYLGAPDVERYVPADCFVDRRRFGSLSELHAFLKAVSDDELRSYRERIRAFAESPAGREFSAERFAESVATVVTGVS